jgi:hypothetical protein
MHTSRSLHFIVVQCLDMFRAFRDIEHQKCSESEVCIKLVVLLRNYVTDAVQQTI